LASVASPVWTAAYASRREWPWKSSRVPKLHVDQVDQLGAQLVQAEDRREVGDGDDGFVRDGELAGVQVVQPAALYEAVGLGGDALHRGQHARPGLLPLGALAFPLRQPGRHQAAPVGAEADRQGVTVGGVGVGADLALRVEDEEGLVGVDVGVHEVADAFVGGEEVVEAPVGGVGDALLFGAVAEVLHAVPGAEAGPLAEVVDVDLAGVPGERLGEAEEVGAAASEVRVPQPQVG
jgi:hypothetical protein